MERFDTIIIGGGPGGTAAARVLARGGNRVALVEDRTLGGTCLNRGCVPTKLLLGAVNPLNVMENLARGRIIEGSEHVNFEALREKVRHFVDGTRRTLTLELIHLGVHIIKGHATCLSPHTVSVCERDGHCTIFEGEHLVLACGSRTSTYPGLTPDGRIILGSTTILQQRLIPKSLIIAGGGTIGVELADFFVHMGTRVIIAEAAPQLAPCTSFNTASQNNPQPPPKFFSLSFFFSFVVVFVSVGIFIICPNFTVKGDFILLYSAKS